MYFILFTSRNKSFVSSCKQYRTFICWNMLFCCGCTPCTLCKPRSTGALHQLHAGPKPQTPLLPLGTKLRASLRCSSAEVLLLWWTVQMLQIWRRVRLYRYAMYVIWLSLEKVFRVIFGWNPSLVLTSELRAQPDSLFAVWALQFSLNLCWTLYNNTNRCNSMVFKVCFTTFTVCWSFTL